MTLKERIAKALGDDAATFAAKCADALFGVAQARLETETRALIQKRDDMAALLESDLGHPPNKPPSAIINVEVTNVTPIKKAKGA